jgi:hypothetical protein
MPMICLSCFGRIQVSDCSEQSLRATELAWKDGALHASGILVCLQQNLLGTSVGLCMLGAKITSAASR